MRELVKNIIRDFLIESIEDSWSNGDKKFTLRQLLGFIKQTPVQNVSTEKLLKTVLNWGDNPQENEKVEKSDLQYPVLVLINDDNSIKCILDGNHRVQKAIRNNLPTVKCKLIKFSELPEYFKEVLR